MYWLFRWHQVLLQQSRSSENSSFCTRRIPQSCWSSPVRQTRQSPPQVTLKSSRFKSRSSICEKFNLPSKGRFTKLCVSPASSLTVSYAEHQKDASYITVSSRPTADSEPSARIVKSMSLRAAVAKGQIVRLGESNKTTGTVKPSVVDVNNFFRRLSFKHQVRNTEAGSASKQPYLSEAQ